MPSYWTLVKHVIQDADILLLVLDARLVNESRNSELERRISDSGKPIIYILNKCDLVNREETQKLCKELQPSVMISAKEHLGVSKLRERIHIEAKRLHKKEVVVGVLGYPNVGKSSLINALKGRKSASTSPLSGHTKGLQRIRVGRRILLMDTPGVIPYNEPKEKHFIKHAAIGSIDYTHIREPDIVVVDLLSKFPGRIEAYYGVESNDDPYDTILEIAKKRRVLKKGGTPDEMRIARMILTDWQKGRIAAVKPTD